MHLIKGFKLEIYFANGRAILIAFKKKLELISRSLVHSCGEVDMLGGPTCLQEVLLVMSWFCSIKGWWNGCKSVWVILLWHAHLKIWKMVFCWAFIGVYGPNINSEIRILWEEFLGLLTWWDLPSCLGGDFNVTRFPSEKSGGSHITTSMKEFSNFISKHAHTDFPLLGGTFTWSNNCEIPSWSRINGFCQLLTRNYIF